MVIVMMVSAAVAVLVVFLKPLADDWFDRKKRRIKFKLDQPAITKTPLPNVKLKFDKFEFDRVLGYDAVIANETGRTLRSASFEICCAPGTPPDGFCWLIIDGNAQDVATHEAGISKWRIEREEIGRNQAIAVYVLSTVEQTINLKTQDDFEIYSVTTGLTAKLGMMNQFSGVLEKASWAAILAATISAVAGIALR